MSEIRWYELSKCKDCDTSQSDRIVNEGENSDMSHM